MQEKSGLGSPLERIPNFVRVLKLSAFTNTGWRLFHAVNPAKGKCTDSEYLVTPTGSQYE